MRQRKVHIRSLLIAFLLFIGALTAASAQNPIPYLKYFEDEAHWKKVEREIPIEWVNLDTAKVQIVYTLDGETITPTDSKIEIPQGHHRLCITIKENEEKKWEITYNLNAE